jgi:ribonuclease HII
VGASDAFEIDRVNILEAARLAMRRAVESLSACDYLLVDAIKVHVALPQKAVIHGDALSFSIAAASILAKTARDRALVAWDEVFPGYGLQHNKGYSTPDHIAALERLGPTWLHRFSFEPVRLSAPKGIGALDGAWTGYPRPREPKQVALFACP